MSEFLEQMSAILSRPKIVASVQQPVTEAVIPPVVKEPIPAKLVECHFVMNDSMRRVRHIAMRIHEGKLIMWSRKGKGLNPTQGVNESVSSHVPQSTGLDRFDREENFRTHMESVVLAPNATLDSIQEALNAYTGGRWNLYSSEVLE